MGHECCRLAYAFHDKRIVFRTSVRGPLAELADPHAVAFEVDALDEVMRTGAWSLEVSPAAVKEPEDVNDLWRQGDIARGRRFSI